MKKITSVTAVIIITRNCGLVELFQSLHGVFMSLKLPDEEYQITKSWLTSLGESFRSIKSFHGGKGYSVRIVDGHLQLIKLAPEKFKGWGDVKNKKFRSRVLPLLRDHVSRREIDIFFDGKIIFGFAEIVHEFIAKHSYFYDGKFIEIYSDLERAKINAIDTEIVEINDNVISRMMFLRR